jgi:hypothetical protein
MREWYNQHHAVRISKKSYDKYVASEPLIQPGRFVEQCIELYLTNETFNLLVHGCVLGKSEQVSPEDLTN